MKILSEEEVDLIFVDINMPDLNGLDFIRSLVNRPLVIFTTAYSEYAVEGFKLDAVDYLLKPFEFQDLLKAADKARRQFEYRLLEQQGEIGKCFADKRRFIIREERLQSGSHRCEEYPLY